MREDVIVRVDRSQFVKLMDDPRFIPVAYYPKQDFEQKYINEIGRYHHIRFLLSNPSEEKIENMENCVIRIGNMMMEIICRLSQVELKTKSQKKGQKNGWKDSDFPQIRESPY